MPGESPQTVQRPHSRTFHGVPRYALVAAIAAGIVIAALGSSVVLFRDTWKRHNQDKILSLCNEATALAKAGEVTQFDAKRAAILALVGTREVENQELKAALQRVEDAGNILAAATKREAQKIGQVKEEKRRFEAQAKLGAEENQRQKEEAERLALEDKTRQEDADVRRRAEEAKQRLAVDRYNAERERERLVAGANRRAEEEKQKKVEAQTQAEEQQRREAKAMQAAAQEQRRQETMAALTMQLARTTASLEQAKAVGRAAVQERNQLEYKYNSERQQVQEQYATMVNEIEKRYRTERRSVSIPGSAEETERRRSDRLLAAEAWRTDQYREIDRRYQPQIAPIDRKIAQMEEVVKSLTQSEAGLKSGLQQMR